MAVLRAGEPGCCYHETRGIILEKVDSFLRFSKIFLSCCLLEHCSIFYAFLINVVLFLIHIKYVSKVSDSFGSYMMGRILSW